MKRARTCRVCRKNPCGYRPRRKNDADPDLEFPPRPRGKSLKREIGARRGWDKRREADEAVAVNLDAHELPAWDKEKARFKGTPEQRLRAFRHYMHGSPDVVPYHLERESDAKLARLIKEHEYARTVAVPCGPPWRFRTKELCKMQNPKRRGRSGGRKKKNHASHECPRCHRPQRGKKLCSACERTPALPGMPKEKRKPEQIDMFKKNPRGKRGKASHRKRNGKTAVVVAVKTNPRESAVALFKKLHWDLPPDSTKPVELDVAAIKGPFAVLGVLKEIGYEAQKGTRERFLWEHKFGPTKTLLVVNADGDLLIAKTQKHGGYRVTARGIEG